MINFFKKIKPSNIFSLLKVFIDKPLFLLPAVKATFYVLKICQIKFGNSHFGNGKENAYRHALWNMLMMYFSRHNKHSLEWTKNFATEYEEIFNNPISDKLMDKHNNKVGREIFLTNKFNTVTEMESFLDKKLLYAKPLNKNTINLLQNTPNLLHQTLVYLED